MKLDRLLLGCVFGLAVSSVSCLAQQDLSIQMLLSKTTVLLGEPVWVDVTVANQSSHPVRVDMGANCFGVKPIRIVVPGTATAPTQTERRCYQSFGGSCPSSGPSLLKPGDTLKRRYVLADDFRIVHPGHYRVFLEKQISYMPVLPGENPDGMRRNPLSQSARGEASLDVQPADPAKLLSLEQALAGEYAQRYASPSGKTAAKPLGTTPEARRRAQELQGEQIIEAVDAEIALGAGLAEYTAAGMEPVYKDWIIRQWKYGLTALSNLNTPEARRLVAQAADPSEDLRRQWLENIHRIHGAGNVPVEEFTQRQIDTMRAAAIHTLARMGDPSFSPLLEKLAEDTSNDVRWQAINNLGLLGGTQELQKLEQIARSAPHELDRETAIVAMGDIRSLKAVPVLIELLTLPNAGQPSASNDALMTLTHHRVEITSQRDARQIQEEWEQWWHENKAHATAYGPFACADAGNIFAARPQ